jgi:hypothetical protein
MGVDPTNTEEQEAVEDDSDNKDDDDMANNKNGEANDGDGGADKKSTANNAECPKHWTFTGWMAFKAYALIPLDSQFNLHISKEDNNDIISKAEQIKSGHATAQKEDLDAKNKLLENAIAASSSDEL